MRRFGRVAFAPVFLTLVAAPLASCVRSGFAQAPSAHPRPDGRAAHSLDPWATRTWKPLAQASSSGPGLSFLVVPSRSTILPSRLVGNESSVVCGVGILPECAPPACRRLTRLEAFPVYLSDASSSQLCAELPGLAFPIGIGSQTRSFLPPSTSPAEGKKTRTSGAKRHVSQHGS